MKFQQRKNYYPLFLFFFIILIFPRDSQAIEHGFRGQLSGWMAESGNKETWNSNSGLRYIPQLILEQDVNENSFFDTEISLNSFLTLNSGNSSNDSDLEFYRFKLRFATTQTETRIGLQKINFGPALLLRPLRWFDRVDERDPLKLTEGVYGLRFKYNALNNANLWLWSLYGNDDAKGYETLPTASGKPEFGGRFQYPVPYGELAATFHSRDVDASLSNGSTFTENRFALDGRWDMEIGFWFESVFQQQNAAFFSNEWTEIITLGMDYTFGVGNGLYVLGEHMAALSLNNPFAGNIKPQIPVALQEWDENQHTSAFYLNYPLGYFDTLMAIGYYSWDKQRYYQYLSWQRTYDNLILNFSLFKYPQDKRNDISNSQTTFGSGYGGQIMIIFNH